MDDFVKALIERVQTTPYFHLDGYQERWWAQPCEEGQPLSMRVHHLLRSDTDAALHCHPWPNISVVMSGGYWDITPLSQDQHPSLDAASFKRVWCGPGAIVSRKATDRHRIEILDGSEAWSLFIMGAWERDWGFWLPTGWVYWRDYLGVPLAEPDPAPGSVSKAR
jgi:hypothetical protein